MLANVTKCSAVLACLLYGCVVAAGEAPTSQAETGSSSLPEPRCKPPGCIDPLAPLFDVHQWTVVQSRFAHFGKEHPHALVQLLKSIRPTGVDGTGDRLLYSVNVIVTDNGQLLYSFTPMTVPQFDERRQDVPFYIDDFDVAPGCPLELRDVTGDKVPEIIFHSGWAAVDNQGAYIHVLQYTNGPTKFRDIRAENFTESWWFGFRWLDLDGRTLGIVSEAVWQTGGPEFTSRASPKFHKYQVYRWDQSKGSFVLSETIPSTGKLHRDGEDPLKIDWAYIEAKLKRHRR